MKIYLFVYTSGGEWDVSKGTAIISAKTKNRAIKIFKNEVWSDYISITKLSPTKEQVLFTYDPVED